ncbi:MAG: YdcF family protein [Anaerolineales bacterium]|nr:YdcF family protein [Anaerolineales bacterium]
MIVFKVLLWVCIAIFLLGLPRWILSTYYADRIHSPEEARIMPTAIVFGAGLRSDGHPTTVLADRVSTAVSLYQQGKVKTLLMSGSSNASGYGEAAAMLEFAMQLGVPEDAILIDSEGDRTYLTCTHAKEIFGVEQALLVTQRFHLPRALILCDALSIESEGIAADLRHYSAQSIWTAREVGATFLAFWEAGRLKTAVLWGQISRRDRS